MVVPVLLPLLLLLLSLLHPAALLSHLLKYLHNHGLRAHPRLLLDLLSQLRQLKKMGGMSSLMNFLPGMGKIKEKMAEGQIDEGILKRQEAIILSMTKQERRDPDIIKAKRKLRIAEALALPRRTHPFGGFLRVTGKGSKARLVPATSELMAELIRYRKGASLSPLPLEGEAMPLMIPLIGPTKPMARSAIHEIVKAVMRESAARLRQRGPEFEAAAAHLEQASTHWMRHTAGSHLSEKADIKVVRDNLGHANISTTSVYLHSEDDARHDATAAVHRVGWATT